MKTSHILIVVAVVAAIALTVFFLIGRTKSKELKEKEAKSSDAAKETRVVQMVNRNTGKVVK